MARRKAEEPASIEGGWINTFADLMNLLLCFFVLLFSMSTVDADKYEQIVTSLSESIDIFSDGGNAVGDIFFISLIECFDFTESICPCLSCFPKVSKSIHVAKKK